MRKLLNSHTDHPHDHSHNVVFDITNLDYRYKTQKENTLHNINLQIHKGCFTTIIGANGSGKSTLVKLLIKLNKFTEGQIHFFDRDIRIVKGKEYSQNVSYIPQSLEVPHGISVYDFVSYGRTPYLGLFGSMTENDRLIVDRELKELGIYE